MQNGMTDEEGSYKPESGDFDDLAQKPEATLTLNPKSVKGMENYRAGDTVILRVKARVPEMDEEGMVELEVVSVTADEMADGPRVARMREKNGTY